MLYRHRALARIAASAAALIVYAQVCAGDETDSDRSLDRVAQQLGAAEFAERERATQELLEIGAEALPALRRAAESDDLELRTRSLRLIEELQGRWLHETLVLFESGAALPATDVLPGWREFSLLAGDAPEARQLFVDMYRSEPKLMQAVDGMAEELQGAFEQRCGDVQLRRVQQRRASLPPATVAALLFLGAHETCRPTAAAAAALYAAVLDAEFLRVLEQSESAGLARSLKPLMGAWIARPDGASATQRLTIATRFELPEGVDVSREIIDTRQYGPQIQQAILFIARFGGTEHIAELERLLDDTTELAAQRRTARNEFSSRVQDVALVAILHLTRQEPKEYGFPSLRPNPQQLYQSGTIGFSSEEQRQTALDKWRTWREAHLKDVQPFQLDAVEGVAT